MVLLIWSGNWVTTRGRMCWYSGKSNAVWRHAAHLYVSYRDFEIYLCTYPYIRYHMQSCTLSANNIQITHCQIVLIPISRGGHQYMERNHYNNKGRYQYMERNRYNIKGGHQYMKRNCNNNKGGHRYDTLTICQTTLSRTTVSRTTYSRMRY